jgi:type II secretory ATPase GspE/PulE/Tfp pilus assembly ATPase PilB-like protein
MHMTTIPVILADQVTAFLESPWKPFLMILPFIPWAWIVSSKLDKDARYFHLNPMMWNGIHLGAGVAALAAMLFVPVFFIGWPVAIVILAVPVLIYWRHRNEQVPEAQRYSLTGASIASRMDERRQARASRQAMVEFSGPDGARPVPLKDDPLYPVHMAVEDLILPALDARASMVDVAISKTTTAVAQTVDGVRYKREAIAPELGLRVVNYLKEVAGLDVEDQRRRQVASLKMRSPSGTTELSATTAGVSGGLTFRLEFDRAKRLSKPFDALGLLPSQKEGLDGLAEVHDRHGIVLVGAPAGHGLSTSLYSFVGRHDAYTSNIKTLEREVLLEIDGIDHVEWDPTNPDVDFATALQSMLRRDPDIVMCGYVKDSDTAQVIVEPGMQGPLIYVAQRAADIPNQIKEWVKAVGDLKAAAKPLRAVINQRLVRTLCPNCRQPFQPTGEQLKKFNLPAGKVSQLYRAGGKVQVKNKIEDCPVCGGSGYLGQTGVFQVLLTDDEIRKNLGAGDLDGAMSQARRNKMVLMQEAALNKVVSGETTLEEVVRVFAPAKGKTAPQKPSPAPAG